MDQGRDGPQAMLTNIAKALTLESARRTVSVRHRSELPSHAPPHAPEVETLDTASIIAVSGGGGGVCCCCSHDENALHRCLDDSIARREIGW